jgi:probable HAF family extracellular repeat protein
MLAAALLIAAVANSQSFTPIGELPGGLDQSAAYGISTDGSTIVGRSESANGEEAFRWTADGGMVPLGDLAGGDFASSATSASSDGALVVGRGAVLGGDEGFEWTEAGGLVGLGVGSTALDVSDDGTTVVGWSGFPVEATRWTSGVPMGLGFLPSGSLSVATAVAGDGSVIVGADMSSSGLFEGFRWTPGGGMVGLGVPSGNAESEASGVSGDGSVVVGTGYDTYNITSGAQAFRWTSGSGMVALGWPSGSTGSRAEGVSADGSYVVGFVEDAAVARRAALWEASGGWQSLQQTLELDCGLDLTGWQLQVASGIAAQGGVLRISGYGSNPDGDQEAFLAEIPEAGCAQSIPAVPVALLPFALLLLLASGLAAARRMAATAG